MRAAAAAPSRVDSVMAAEALAEDAMNADVTEVQALVIATAEARTLLTLVQVAAGAVSRVDSALIAKAAASDAMVAHGAEADALVHSG